MNKILLTTTSKSSDQAKRMAKLLQHVIPSSSYLARGKQTVSQLILNAEKQNVDKILIISSKGNTVNQINFYERSGGGYHQDAFFLRILDFIDPRIFNQQLKTKGPMSTSFEVRAKDPELIALFEKYFELQVGTKTALWFMVDFQSHSNEIMILDAITMNRLAQLRIQVKKRS
ncbi:MAG: hypothetical protein INQ03_13005 [Candidatus Heimdallarchaeota archaeon]|nr:hypothetical protein [Candidatus Heimdallarchaeota archaeon]